MPGDAVGDEAIVVHRTHGRAPSYAVHDADGEVVVEASSWAAAELVFERAREPS